MLSCSISVEINGTQDEAWRKLAEFHQYPNWSPCFSFVQNASPESMSFVDSEINFHMVRFKDRIKRTAVIKEFTAPHNMTFTFARPHAFWLRESWVITIQTFSESTILVGMTVEYSGWTHVKAYQEESIITQAFCDTHLEALKMALEALDDDADNDFPIDDL